MELIQQSPTAAFKLQHLLNDSHYSLAQFSAELIAEFEQRVFFKSAKTNDIF
jgi:hypothetical protein